MSESINNTNSINAIHVTAEYVNTPSTQFEALKQKLAAVTKLADETESFKQPLIDAMGKKKLELVYKQLDNIVNHLREIAALKGTWANQSVEAHSYLTVVDQYGRSSAARKTVNVVYRGERYSPVIYLDGWDEEKGWWFDKDGIITNWNKLKLYEKLEEACCKQLESLIEIKAKKTENIDKNFENMIND